MNTQILDAAAIFSDRTIFELVQRITEPVTIVQQATTKQVGLLPYVTPEALQAALRQHNLNFVATLPPLYPEWLGEQSFLKTHGTRFPYIVGEMANGITSAEMVIAAAKAGMISFFGAGGLMPAIVEQNLQRIRAELGEQATNWGANLIHSPNEPAIEQAVVDLYLRLGVKRVSASAYMALSPQVVRYAATGLKVDPSGKIIRQNYVLAKLSRPEVAKHFISPPPQELLNSLVEQGKLTQLEAELAAKIPVAEDITVEGDSGGHTDNRPLNALFATIHQLAIELTQKYGYQQPIRIGAAGGLATPSNVAAAFSLGAAYVLTGSINAAAVESALSAEAKKMLAAATITDVMMAPAADMFELGVKVQILKRGTMFGPRAQKLYELYSKYPAIETIPAPEKLKIEQQIFRDTLENIWESTRQFFLERDPKQIKQAEQDPRYKMALIFRWYLGQATRWAIRGETQRQQDYQIWCGPAIGAFNAWVAGTCLEDLSQRTIEQIGKNLLTGAAVITRAQQLRSFGVTIPAEAFHVAPRIIR